MKGEDMSYLDFDFPHTRFFESDLRELIKQVFIMNDLVTNFVSINAIKYADPIQWNITKSYEKNTVVIDGNSGVAYISVRPVPPGVSLTRENYWTKVFDLSLFIVKAGANFANTYEAEATDTATKATSKDNWIVWDSTLYKALNDIHIGDRYVPDGNIEKATVEDFYNALKSIIDNEVHEREAGDDALELALNDEIETRGEADATLHQEIVQESVDRENADSALQDNIDAETTAREAVDAKIGDLANLNTAVKTNTVAAINEVLATVSASRDGWVTPEDYGAIGDATTDDTAAVQAAFSSGKNVRFLNDYAVRSVTFEGSESIIDFNGHYLKGIGTTDDFVMIIKAAMYNVFYNLNITANQSTTYYGCLQIVSTTIRQAQYNVFYGMRFSHAWHGLVWGAKDGDISIENAQSETFIFGFRDRTVCIPFLGNQRNGYITFIGGVFDTNQYEVWADNRYSFDNARCIKNPEGQVNTIGCEFACTTNVNHIAFEGKYIYAYDSIIEVCGTQAFITGNFALINWYNGFIGQAIKTPFIINNGAEGIVTLENGEFHHGGIEVYNSFMYGYDAPKVKVYIKNVTWRDTPYGVDTFGNLNVYCDNFAMPVDNIHIRDNDVSGMSFIDDNSTDVTAFGTFGEGVTGSFNDIQELGERGIGIQFGNVSWQDWFSDYIPVYGGTLFHDNHVMVSTGTAHLFLECYDANKLKIDGILLQTSNTTVLNRSSLRYLPTGTKYVRLHVTNGENTNAPYVILADCRLTAAGRLVG